VLFNKTLSANVLYYSCYIGSTLVCQIGLTIAEEDGIVLNSKSNHDFVCPYLY